MLSNACLVQQDDEEMLVPHPELVEGPQPLEGPQLLEGPQPMEGFLLFISMLMWIEISVAGNYYDFVIDVM